jgi:hypothetical protein
MRFTGQFLITLTALCSLLIATHAHAIEQPYRGPFVENDDLLMVLIPHTPEQITAFYEARGFPKAALDQLRKVCFVTVHIENKSQRVIWLETANWDLAVDGERIQRINKQQWTGWWDDINLPSANRSTFSWTQLPTVRDLQPDEPVGGNIILDGDVTHFDLQARFLTAQNKRGGMLDIQFRNIKCPKEESRP